MEIIRKRTKIIKKFKKCIKAWNKQAFAWWEIFDSIGWIKKEDNVIKKREVALRRQAKLNAIKLLIPPNIILKKIQITLIILKILRIIQKWERNNKQS